MLHVLVDKAVNTRAVTALLNSLIKSNYEKKCCEECDL